MFAFDPTPRAIAHVAKFAAGVPKYHFQPIGVWETDTSLKFFEPRDPQHVSHSLLNLQKTSGGFDAQVRRLSNVMRDLGHSHIDLLKLDIEGAEYKVLETIFEDRIDVGVLCVEFDEFFNPLDAQYVKRIDRALGNLERHGFVLAHTTGTANYTFVRSRR